MAANLTLPRDAASTVLSITLPRDAAPYVRDQHARSARPGESVRDFVLRTIIRNAVEERHRVLFSSEFDERNTTGATEETRRTTELATVLGALGV